MTNVCIEATGNDIHVMRGPGEAWLVARDGRVITSANYRLRAHAVAFARAMAFNAHADMIVHDSSGHSTRHARASLGYPTSLD